MKLTEDALLDPDLPDISKPNKRLDQYVLPPWMEEQQKGAGDTGAEEDQPKD